MEVSNRKYSQHYSKALKYAHLGLDNFMPSKVKNIDDKLPHLIHADHLEENGFPTAAHIMREAANKGRVVHAILRPTHVEGEFDNDLETPLGITGFNPLNKKANIAMYHTGQAEGKTYFIKYETPYNYTEHQDLADALHSELHPTHPSFEEVKYPSL